MSLNLRLNDILTKSTTNDYEGQLVYSGKQYLPEVKKYNTGLRYYYEDPNDFKTVEEGGLNLSNKHRRWISSQDPNSEKSGREQFNDPFLYRPIDLSNFINRYYIEPFRQYRSDHISPFEFGPNYVHKTTKEICSPKDKSFILSPHQKFCGQYISNQTDFPGAIFYHGLGSGKTTTSIMIAESMKSKFIMGDTVEPIKGRSVKLKVNSEDIYCSVTIIVPKQIIDQYIREIIGTYQDGVFKSCTGACIIYTDPDPNDPNPDPNISENGYKQQYIGTVLKDHNNNVILDSHGHTIYKIDDLNKIAKCEKTIETIKAHRSQLELLSQDSSTANEYRTKLQKDILVLDKDLADKEREIKIYKSNINKKINEIYFVVSEQTFIKKLGDTKDIIDEKGNKSTKTVVSDYVKGSQYIKSSGSGTEHGTYMHPDCFHSQKSLLIVDEIHKNVGEIGKMHEHLFNALYVYARDIITGQKAMKVVLLTATPVFDHPHQMAMMVNLLRPRILFPKDKKIYESMFLDKKNRIMKNKLLHQFMISGYVSYFKGGNPDGYPFRRNYIIQHKMNAIQYAQYIDYLQIDLKQRDLQKKFKTNTDDVNKNKFSKSISASLFAFPANKSASEDMPYVKSLHRDIQKTNFKEQSQKLYWVGRRLLESSETDNGPIFVYSSRVARGLLPLIIYMESLGFELLTDDDLKKTPNDLHAENVRRNLVGKRFGIYGGKSHKYFSDRKATADRPSLRLSEEDSYKNNLQKILNDPVNGNGSLCKIIFGKIEEGVSFQGISEIHVLDPWWNESKMEQIIGRGIRFCSHSRLDPSRQYVDVYYHCNILPDLKSKDPKLGRFNEMTIDQYIFTAAKAKNDMNNSFDNALKESAIDYDLNKNGNIIRLEEFNYPNIKEIVFYNRSENMHYVKTPDDKFMKVTLKWTQISNFGSIGVFPPIDYNETDIIVNPITYRTVIDNNKRLMTLAVFYENHESFSNDQDTNKMSFEELRKYAISKGEDPITWAIAFESIMKDKMIDILLGNNLLKDETKMFDLQKNLMYNMLEIPIPSNISQKKRESIIKNSNIYE